MTEAELLAGQSAYQEWQQYKSAYDNLGLLRSEYNISGRRLVVKIEWEAPNLPGATTLLEPEAGIDTVALMEHIRTWLATQRDIELAQFTAL